MAFLNVFIVLTRKWEYHQFKENVGPYVFVLLLQVRLFHWYV
jgi:hypothetical protein